ncbi:Protein of unknown function [Bacillus wiedmannii]|nr:Protein of unknown function [Bacillus wiedmannii]
MKKVLPNED